MKCKFTLLLIILQISLFAQYSINYTAYSNGARIGGSTASHFSPGYGSLGACGAGNWRWVHALCSDSDIDDPSKSVKSNHRSGSTWASGSAQGYMVIDLGTVRSFNQLAVFQMFSDGKVTHLTLYAHPDTSASSTAPVITNTEWVEKIPETSIGAGLRTGSTVTGPTVIDFNYVTTRFIRVKARNDGSLGSPNYIEIRELKLFNTNITLPVSLTKFELEKNHNNEVLVNWQTATEVNNDFFTIEKSKDGMDWTEVTKVKGAGNSNNLLDYSFVDKQPWNGTSYYRLKQTDFDGMFEYFDIKTINSDSNTLLDLIVYPNPTNNKIVNIESSSVDFANAKINVFDILGKPLRDFNFTMLSKTKARIEFNSLSLGVYYLNVNGKTLKIFIK